MRVAIVGSRSLSVNIEKYIPEIITEIVPGGAKGIDTLAGRWADQRNIPTLILKPDYNTYGRVAPIRRNELIVEAADLVVAVWDGKSRGTKFTIGYAKKCGVPVEVLSIKSLENTCDFCLVLGAN